MSTLHRRDVSRVYLASCPKPNAINASPELPSLLKKHTHYLEPNTSYSIRRYEKGRLEECFRVIHQGRPLSGVGTEDKQPSTLTISRQLILDLMAPVHVHYGHPGVAHATLLLRNHPHWNSLNKGCREYVLSCRCRRRNRARTQQVAMLPSSFLQSWEVLEIDFQDAHNTFAAAGNRYKVLIAD